MKISKKRFVKVLMSEGISRNKTSFYTQFIKIFGSYEELAKALCGNHPGSYYFY